MIELVLAWFSMNELDNERDFDILRPSFAGLDSEKGEHGRYHIVVVERVSQPLALLHFWLFVLVRKLKEFAPKLSFDANKNLI